MKSKLIFLGCGGSVGVPVIACSCRVCKSTDLHNKRLRPSVLLKMKEKNILIDVGPDFRMQALKHQITSLDGILLTHAHHDHTAGMDDLRPLLYHRKSPLPLLLSSSTFEEMSTRFYYLFPSSTETNKKRFQVQYLPSTEYGRVIFEGINIDYVTYTQGGMNVNGFRIGDMAYISDIRHYSTKIFEYLSGVKYLIISALRYGPSELHFSVEEAVEFSQRLKASKTWLTHLSHDLDYEETNANLPANIRLAYDELEIEFQEDL